MAACIPQRQAGLGGRRGGGLLLPGHGDGPLAVAGVHVGGDLGAREGQHAVVGQGAGDGSLVHVGGQAVPAVKFAGDIAVVVLRGSGERGQGPSETPQHHAVPPSARPRGSIGGRSTFGLAYRDTVLLVSPGDLCFLLYFTGL